MEITVYQIISDGKTMIGLLSEPWLNMKLEIISNPNQLYYGKWGFILYGFILGPVRVWGFQAEKKVEIIF